MLEKIKLIFNMAPEGLKKFFEKWLKFFGVVLSPGSVIPLILAAICLYSGFKNVNNFSLAVLLSVTASMLTAISGFFIKDDWDKLQGSSLLQKKGRSAIRNLESIGQQVGQIRGWIKDFCGEKTKKLSSEHLQEIDRHLVTTEFNITSGLEDWIDIVPELRQRDEIRKHYEDTIQVVIEEVLKNKKELAITPEDNQKRGQLEKRIKDLESNLKSLEKKESFTLSPIPLPPRYVRRPVVCNKCSKRYIGIIGPHGLNVGSGLCPDCENKKEV